jgi:hypothetical protein
MKEMPGSLWREIAMIAATDTGPVPMRVSKAVALQDGDDLFRYVVLDELDEDRLVITASGAIMHLTWEFRLRAWRDSNPRPAA